MDTSFICIVSAKKEWTTADIKVCSWYVWKLFYTVRRNSLTCQITMVCIADGSPLPPVLLGHGLFQCSGDFVLNEENSLAFALVEQGYDVWMGNTRATSTLDHVSLSHKDPEYWAWGLKELSLHDLVCALDFVGKQTGFNKVHSTSMLCKV